MLSSLKHAGHCWQAILCFFAPLLPGHQVNHALRPFQPQILAGTEAGQQLLMNDRYFFSLLERMVGDVSRQPEGEQRAQLLARLGAVQADAAAAADKAAANTA